MKFKTFRDLTKTLNLSNLIVRTTEERHKTTVIKLWLLDQKNQIYLSACRLILSLMKHIMEDEIDDIDGKKVSILSEVKSMDGRRVFL